MIKTDHRALQFLREKKESGSTRLHAWTQLIEVYQPDIKYTPGSKIPHVDAISRCHDNCSEPEHALAEAIWTVTSWNAVVKKAQAKDRWTQPILAALQSTPSISELGKTYVLKEGLLYCTSLGNNQLAVPEVLRPQILAENHDSPLAAHGGIESTFIRIRSAYYWPRIFRTVEDYVNKCITCARNKTQPSRTPRDKGKHIVSTMSQAFSRVNVDIMGPFPVTERNNQYIVVFTDLATRFSETCALPDHTAMTVANALVEKVICRHGSPAELRSDQGAEFMSELMHHACSLLQIEHVASAPYSPWSNGAVERVNGSICSKLAHIAQTCRKEWDLLLPYATAAYISARHSTTGVSPFEMLYGRQYVSPGIASLQTSRDALQQQPNPSQYLVDMANRMRLVRELAIQHEDHQHKLTAKPRSASAIASFKVGDLVMLRNQRVPAPSEDLPNKLAPKFSGPWQVTASLGDSMVTIQNKESGVRTSQHVKWLKKAMLPNQGHKPPPATRATQPCARPQARKRVALKLEKVLDERQAPSGLTEYLVECYDYETSWTAWMPEEDLFSGGRRSLPLQILKDWKTTKARP